LTKIKYQSAVGEVTFDDHNQARLPMILLQIEGGKPSIKGAYTAEIQYPAK
jgi:branched-chain amino acid transport system substrate-binding protein